jgi:hypothetical protein
MRTLLAHAGEHGDSGLLHALTEPDHLAALAAIVVGTIVVVGVVRLALTRLKVRRHVAQVLSRDGE